MLFSKFSVTGVKFEKNHWVVLYFWLLLRNFVKNTYSLDALTYDIMAIWLRLFV